MVGPCGTSEVRQGLFPIFMVVVKGIRVTLNSRRYNKRMLKGRASQVKSILSEFSYNRRIAGQRGHFTMEDYHKWLKKAETDDLARALRRLAQLNQSKVYLFWKR